MTLYQSFGKNDIYRTCPTITICVWRTLLYFSLRVIFIFFDSSDIGGRSLSSPNAEMQGIIPCNSQGIIPWTWSMSLRGVIPFFFSVHRLINQALIFMKIVTIKRLLVLQYHIYISTRYVMSRAMGVWKVKNPKHCTHARIRGWSEKFPT